MKKNQNREKFAQFDKDMYADWLWRGLYSFYTSHSDRAKSFDPFGPFIIQKESVFEGLARVYEEYVPEDRKLIFRKAIGQVLRKQADNIEAPIPAFQDLIYLLARIKATESLGALLPVVGNGLIRKKYPDILYDTIAVLKLFATVDEAYEAAFDLVDSAYFDDGYLFEAIKVFVECKPQRTSKTLLNLVPRLNQLRQDVMNLNEDEQKAFNEAAKDCVHHVLILGTLSWIADFWKKTSHSTDEGWLFYLLFNNENIPIKLKRDDIGYYIIYRSKRVDLKVSDKDHWTRDKYLEKSTFEEAYNMDMEPHFNSFIIDQFEKNLMHFGPKNYEAVVFNRG